MLFLIFKFFTGKDHLQKKSSRKMKRQTTAMVRLGIFSNNIRNFKPHVVKHINKQFKSRHFSRYIHNPRMNLQTRVLKIYIYSRKYTHSVSWSVSQSVSQIIVHLRTFLNLEPPLETHTHTSYAHQELLGRRILTKMTDIIALSVVR